MSVARSPSLALLLVLPALAAPPARAAAAPRPVVVFEDPAGDATGPGTYVPPGDTEFEDGDFDLRRFAVLVEGDEAILEVTLGARIRRPASTQRSNLSPLPLANGLYLQNVDVYVDTDRAAGSGFSACIPGRRVAFADGRTWEAAVVLTPQPGPARAIVAEAMGPAAARVFLAEGIEARGRTLVARVPLSALGGTPSEDWGWSVHVTGARWERTYALQDRLRGAREPDAFTMPVLGVPEAWAFGGAPAGDAHPRVVDVLLPPGVDQAKVLGAFDADAGSWARVPFVEARSAPKTAPAPVATGAAPAEPAPGETVLRVVDVSGDLVTLEGPVEGLVPLQLGRVLGEDGETVGRVVVVRVLGGGVVASVIEGEERVARGARVGFPSGSRH